MHSADHSTGNCVCFVLFCFVFRFTLYQGENVFYSTLPSLLCSTTASLICSQSATSQNLPDHESLVEWTTLMLCIVMSPFLCETHHLHKLLICTEVLSLLKLHVCKKGVEVSFVLSDQWCVRKASLFSCTQSRVEESSHAQKRALQSPCSILGIKAPPVVYFKEIIVN